MMDDIWAEEKKRIEEFYLKFFNREVIWSKIVIPVIKKAGMNRLEVIFSDINEDEAFSAYVKKFGVNAVWKYYDSITGAIHEQQERPAGDYAFYHVGGDEADMLVKSYNDGIKFMAPKEGIVAAFRYRAETGKMYDVEGLTRFSAFDSAGDALLMRRGLDGQFYINRISSNSSYADCGLRKICL